MTKEAVLALDQGTTGSTAVLYDPQSWTVLGRANVPFAQHFPQPGWVEHSPKEIWQSVIDAIETCMNQLSSPVHIGSIGLTNQRETVVCFNPVTGISYGNALVWQDRRTTMRCQKLKEDTPFVEHLHNLTGLLPDPYFSASKIEWILENSDEAKQAVARGEAKFATIDAWLLSRLTGGLSFATEPTNACRTLLFDLHTRQYSGELLELFGVNPELLPPLQPSISLFGKTKGVPGLADGIPIEAILGDQQAALYGQGALSPGEAKVTYGTGAFILMNTGHAPVVPGIQSGLLASVALEGRQGTTYCLEGACFIAGAAVQFARDQLGLIDSAEDSEQLAQSEPADPHLHFVPSLTGLSAPFWNPKARGALFGLTRGTSRAQVMRAILDSIALQITPFVQAMESAAGMQMKWLGVDGGAAANSLLMQKQADLLQLELLRPRDLETTARGAAQAAWSHRHGDAVDSDPKEREDVTHFRPKIAAELARHQYEEWLEAARSVDTHYSKAT